MEKEFLYFENVLDRISEIPEDTIVSRTIYSDERIKMILFGFAPGQELSEHTASIPAIIHILEGEATISVEHEHFNSAAGSWLYMKPKIPHSIHAKTPLKMLLYMIEGKDLTD